MSLTLGEKLRQAREERGISISDVAEQTRISTYYLESIERDDYKPLPGGIFNKGFVKSFAKYVDIDEQEALADYSRILASNDTSDEPSLKVYRPEVLTDDHSGRSMIPTIVMAIVILGLMCAGIYFFSTNYQQLLGYFQGKPSTENKNAPANTNSNSSTATNSNASPLTISVPDMATLKVEFKVSSPVSLTATSDGNQIRNVVNPETPATFDPKDSLKLSYHSSLAKVVELSINGKSIKTPAQPLQAGRAVIEFEINKNNLPQIWQNGAISSEVPTAVNDIAGQPKQPVGGKQNAAPKTVITPAPKPIDTPKPSPSKPVGNRP